MFKRVLAYFSLPLRLPGGFFPFWDLIREALSLCEPLFSISTLGFELWAPSGPFTLSAHYELYKRESEHPPDVSFSCVVKAQRRWSNKIYKTQLTKTRYNHQVLGKYQVDPQRAVLTLIVELTWSNFGLKGVLNKRK